MNLDVEAWARAISPMVEPVKEWLVILVPVVTVLLVWWGLGSWRRGKKYEAAYEAVLVISRLKTLIDHLYRWTEEINTQALARWADGVAEKEVKGVQSRRDDPPVPPKGWSHVDEYAVFQEMVDRMKVATKESETLVHRISMETIPIVRASLGKRLLNPLKKVKSKFNQLQLPDIEMKNAGYVKRVVIVCIQDEGNLLVQLASLREHLGKLETALRKYTRG